MPIASQGAASIPGISVTVDVRSTLVVCFRAEREELVLVNDSDATIYLRLAEDGAEVGKGIRLNANGGLYATTKYHGPVCAVHAGLTGTKNLCVAEV